MRHAARSDDCQPEIVKALRQIGACVYVVKLPLDLLVSIRRPGEADTRTILLECKDAGCKLNAAQQEFWDSWIGEKHVVHGPAEAINAVLGKAAMS